MNFDLKNKKVLVTGGSRGIGAEIAHALAREGAHVTATATSAESVSCFKFKHPESPIEFAIVDFASLEATTQFAKQASDAGYDILVNNAGINKVAPLADVKVHDWQAIQDVNVRAPFLLSQALAKGMIAKKWGRIINISSVFGIVTKEQRLSYTSSKFALLGMTKTMALELAPHGVLVNAISPGFIDTDLTRKVLGPDGIKEMVAKVPMKKLGQPADVANLVLFLASAQNGFMTGANLVLDGGFTCA